MKYIRYVLIALIILLAGGLFGWYFFLRSAENTSSAQDAARGYGTAAPSFTGSNGSTYQNVASTLGIAASTSTNANARLWEISAVPVAGFGWNSTSGKLNFVERSTGYVFEAAPATHAVSRLTDTLRPKTYAALFASDGSVVERGVGDNGALINFAGDIATSTSATATSSPDSLDGIVLPQGIDDLAVDQASRTLVYTLDSSSGAALLSSDWTGSKEKHLLSLPLQGWRIFALDDGGVIIAQKPADSVEGYAYRVQNGSLVTIAQGPGLTILPHTSSPALIFGESADGQLSLFSQMSAGAAPALLPLQTIADKCAWMPGQSLIAYCGVPQNVTSQQFLDDWYKGLIHTSDQWWKIDIAAGTTTLLESPMTDARTALDIEDPIVDPSGNYIAFRNAADQSLWVLRIVQ